MIRQHYNHPSIIAWGYMNEILLTAPGPDRPEWPACRERTVKLAQRLEKTLKQEDPYRASVMAFNMTNLYNESAWTSWTYPDGTFTTVGM